MSNHSTTSCYNCFVLRLCNFE
uniref:Uncharacterized protein n=1 Tax=Rhizophora mucronata TaxID=61149 RepID=A0A2P2QJ62_RHIMU